MVEPISDEDLAAVWRRYDWRDNHKLIMGRITQKELAGIKARIDRAEAALRNIKTMTKKRQLPLTQMVNNEATRALEGNE